MSCHVMLSCVLQHVSCYVMLCDKTCVILC